MKREYLCDEYLSKINTLIHEINKTTPATAVHCLELRAELAGLLVVAIAATYETCIKEILIEHARSKHVEFGGFAKNNFAKINSRIKPNDLKNYCKMFSENMATNFSKSLDKRKKRISTATRTNIEKRYELLLDWRHDYAHAAIKSTTIEEAEKCNRFAKHILYVFEDTFRLEREKHSSSQEVA